MSRRKNFLRWLRQWKPPQEIQEETESTGGIHATCTDATSATPTNAHVCPWCCEPRTKEHWEVDLVSAWQIHCNEDDGYYLACKECRTHERVWAVGVSGKPYRFGLAGETIPRLNDAWGILVDAVAAGQLLGHNTKLGDQ